MKKILIAAIAAVCCFCSCLMESQEDAIYELSVRFENSTVSSKIDPDCNALIKEFTNAVGALNTNNKINWMWVETIYDGHFSKADKEAMKKYEQYVPEVKALFDTYQAKFNALPDNGSSYKANYTFVLNRSLNGDKDIATTDLEINYKSK